jgi:hypothetical protein
MKLIFSITACILFSGVLAAQTGNVAAKKKVRKNAIGGTILDARRLAIPKVQAFIYLGETATNSSGFTDADGYFETNQVMDGTYDLRLVYPSAKRIVVTGIPVKGRRITEVNLITNMPTADSTIAWSDIAPRSSKK